MTDAAKQKRRVVLGRVQGVYGTKGWVKIYSHTDPRENILGYETWLVNVNGQWHEMNIESGRLQGKLVIAKLENICDRDVAAGLMNADIAVLRDKLPPTAGNEIYWTDLEGLRVFNQDDVQLGIVDHLIATGANDVLVVKGKEEVLIPFVRETVIKSIDFDQGIIQVDWDTEHHS